MFHSILQSKLSVPKPGRQIIERPPLAAKLAKITAYPFTIVMAGAGYGKSTAVAQALRLSGLEHGWYSAGPEDDNLAAFSCYLAHALDRFAPGLKDVYPERLYKIEAFHWKTVVILFMSCLEQLKLDKATSFVLILDDWQWLSADEQITIFFDRFLACLPEKLHVVMLSREIINLTTISRARADALLFEIKERDLRLSGEDTKLLLEKISGQPADDVLSQKIQEMTEGWVIAVRLLIESGSVEHCSMMAKLNGMNSFTCLFTYLANNVLLLQDQATQELLLYSSIFSTIETNLWQYVFEDKFPLYLINKLLHKQLFLDEISPGVFRYHQLFLSFLRQEASVRGLALQQFHTRAGHYYLKKGQLDNAIQQFIAAENWHECLSLLEQNARNMVHSSNGQAFCRYYARLPAKLQNNPRLFLALAEEERFCCNYTGAIDYYQQAIDLFIAGNDTEGLTTTYIGMSELYLDTIQPLYAQQYLRKAYKSLTLKQNSAKKSAILTLMSENAVNLGKSRKAGRYLRLGGKHSLQPAPNNLHARILLRTGRISEAIEVLHCRQEYDRADIPKTFRETPMVLTVCYSYIGDYENAICYANQAVFLARKNLSPLTEAIALARVGNTHLIGGAEKIEQASIAYQQARQIAAELNTPRGFTEILQGECLIAALDNDWANAKKHGLEGLRMTSLGQDYWFSSVLYHTLGMAAVLCGKNAEAQIFLDKSSMLFRSCGDTFGEAASCLYKAYIALLNGDKQKFTDVYQHIKTLETANSNIIFLLQKPSLLGDIRGDIRKELLPAAAANPRHKKAQVKVQSMRVFTLGEFKIWQEDRIISSRQWKRDFSRRLFCLLLTARNKKLHRDTIIDTLWPDMDAQTGIRQFRVVLSNMLNVLEPHRVSRQPSQYVCQDGGLFWLNTADDMYLDTEDFEQNIHRGHALLADGQTVQAEKYIRHAINLYAGEFLEGMSLENWFLKERERLLMSYMEAMESLSRLLVKRNECEEALFWADSILHKDNCREQAYRLKMYCYAKMNSPVMIARTFKQCSEVLGQEFAVSPSTFTKKVYEKILDNINSGLS